MNPTTTTLIRDLDRRALSVRTDAIRRRATAFLDGLRHPTRFSRAILAGYTETEHHTGVIALVRITGEFSFGEWRVSQSLTPSKDPDCSAVVDEIDHFARRWRARAIKAVWKLSASDDRTDALARLTADLGRPSRIWSARIAVELVAGLRSSVALAPAWSELVQLGLEFEFEGFDRAMERVRQLMLTAPLLDAELREMHVQRELHAPLLEAWIDERRREHFASESTASLERLGLGMRIPQELPAVRVRELIRFGIGGVV